MSAISKPRAGGLRIVMAGPMPPAIGGMATVARDLCESSLGQDFEMDVFNTIETRAGDRSLVSAVAARWRMWSAWWRVLGRGPAIAHIHTCSGLSYFLDLALLLLARFRGVPVVLHIHGGRFDAFLDELDPLRRLLARGGARLADRVVVLSEGWRERLRPRLPGAELRVVENGVPLAASAGRPRSDGEPLILFLGALTRAKGVEDLVRALARGPASARLALVGPESEPGIAQSLRSIAADLGIANRLILPGAAVGPAKAAWLERASVFVLPSHIEGLPVSLLEAMAAGLPVIATRVGAIPAVIESERTGLLIDAGDVDALAAAIERLLSDPVLRSELGRRARETCSLRFSIERAAKAFRDIYLDIAPTARRQVLS